MGNENVISLKGTGDGVVIRIANTEPFGAVTDAIAEMIRSNRKFFRGNCRVYFESEAPLSKSDIIRLKSVIDTFLPDCEVTYREPGKIDRYGKSKEKEEKNPLKSKGAVETATVYEGDVHEGEHLRAVGNVVIIGNVHEGGAVTAGGSAIVLGDICGTVRCGYPYNEKSYVIFRNLNDGEIVIGEKAYNGGRYGSVDLEKMPTDSLKKAHLINNSIFIMKFL